MKTEMIQSAPATFEVRKVSMNKVLGRFAAFGKTFQLIEDQFKDHFGDVNKMVYLGSVCMRTKNQAPTGRNTIAQGNALGARIYRYPSPVRAQLANAGCYSDQIERRFVPPLQGLQGVVHNSQGVALGYRVSPLCGKNPATLDCPKA